jgi:probable F420-dependent oxidoreductase
VKFGYLSMNPAAGIHPATLAVELEQRGLDSLWVPEHSHIPASRRTPFPGGGDLPGGYYHMMSPLVSLAAAASVTTDLVLATGITLILEHDVLDLACQTATLDVLSGGRLLLGVGVGWNEEELADHRPDLLFTSRYSAGRERVAALRAAWSGSVDGAVSFDGRWDRFEPSYVSPKPARGTIPIAMGNSGPLGMRHAAEYGDEWCPINTSLIGADGHIDVKGNVARFRELVVSFGRDPADVPISLLVFTRPRPQRLEEYAELRLARVVLAALTAEIQPEDDTRRLLDELTPIVAEWSTR